MTTSPLALRIRIARELGALIKPEGGPEVNQTELAQRAELPRQAVYRALQPTSKENLDRRCNPTHVRQIAEALRVDGRRRDRLVAMAAEAGKPGWWDRRGADFDPDQVPFANLADGANSVCEYQSHVVGGLVQTEDYARHRAQAVGHDEAAVERIVTTRMRRAQRLHEADVTYRLLIEKLALTRRIAPPKVMIAQLEHLVELGEMPNVEIRVLQSDGDDAPLSSGYAPQAPFLLYSYADSPSAKQTLRQDGWTKGTDGVYVPEIAVIDIDTIAINDRILVGREMVDLHARLFERLGPVALSGAETATYIQKIADEMKSA